MSRPVLPHRGVSHVVTHAALPVCAIITIIIITVVFRVLSGFSTIRLARRTLDRPFSLSHPRTPLSSRCAASPAPQKVASALFFRLVWGSEDRRRRDWLCRTQHTLGALVLCAIISLGVSVLGVWVCFDFRALPVSLQAQVAFCLSSSTMASAKCLLHRAHSISGGFSLLERASCGRLEYFESYPCA